MKNLRIGEAVRPIYWTLLLLFSLLLIVSGCGGKVKPNSEGGNTSAESESGTVKMLVWQGYDSPKALEPISGKIKVQASYLGANEEVYTKFKASAPGTFDLATIYQGEVPRLIHDGLIEPIDLSQIPNYNDLPDAFKNIEFLKKDGKVYGVPFMWGSEMINYNADLTDAPKSIKELFDPKYKGKIAMPDDAYAVITTFAKVAGFSSHATLLTKDELQKTMDLLYKFKPQLLSIAPNYGELLNMHLRKEVWITLPDWQPTAVAANAEGINVKIAIPEEGGFSYVDSWLISKGSGNVKKDHTLINQAISADAQSIYVGELGSGPVNPKAAPKLDAKVQEIYSFDRLDVVLAKAPLYPPVPTQSETLATYDDWIKAWEQFKNSK